MAADYNPELDREFLRRAYIYSAKAHRGQERASGIPFLSHPLEVTYILTQLQMDTSTLATGLLHDTVEDTTATTDEIRNLFGDEVAQLVDGVTKISQMSFTSQAEKQAENFKKIILATAKDIRVILVKLADRLHNMRTLDALSRQRQTRVSQETMDIYAPLANRLGIHWIKAELDDLCFRYLHPSEFREIEKNLRRQQRAHAKYIQDVIETIQEMLTDRDLVGEVNGRVKNMYSIYQKMIAQNLEFHQVHDLIAFRIILDDVKECYAALGFIHSLWMPVPGRFKDYIALPKENMYQSLHTTVVGPHGDRMEIQIRTKEMHQIAEEGIAAHWGYKEKRKLDEDDDAKFAWLRQLVQWRTEMEDPEEFLDSVKIDLFPNEIYVFTPQGDVIALPKGSTPIDFAYRIHTDVGHQCVGARVNGAIVPLKHEMKSGDRVEVITQKTGRPSRDWLKFVKTSGAKQKIRTYIRKEERARSVQIGRSILEKELRRHKLSLTRLEKEGEIERVGEKLSLNSEESLYAAVGYGKLLPSNVAQHFFVDEAKSAEEQKRTLAERLIRPRRSTGAGVLISGVDDVLVRMSRCCKPLPGEAVVGYITRGRGISVHKVNCPEVQHMDPDRKIEVSWDTKNKESRGMASVEVFTMDTPGLLADVAKVISTSGGDIKNVKITTTVDKHANHRYDIEVAGIEQLVSIIHALEKIRGVLSVHRI